MDQESQNIEKARRNFDLVGAIQNFTFKEA